jgi:hypothetical protein
MSSPTRGSGATFTMRSKYLMRLLAVAASAAAVLGGGSFALAADSAPSASAAGATYYACVVSIGNHFFFPWHSLWKVSTSPVTCPPGSFSINWNQTGPQGPAGPQGQPGTFGSIQTFERSADLPNDTEDTLDVACTSGTLISGGYTIGDIRVHNHAPLISHNLRILGYGRLRRPIRAAGRSFSSRRPQCRLIPAPCLDELLGRATPVGVRVGHRVAQLLDGGSLAVPVNRWCSAAGQGLISCASPANGRKRPDMSGLGVDAPPGFCWEGQRGGKSCS